MTGHFASPRYRLRLAGLVVLIVAILAAVAVYIAAASQPEGDALAYQIVGGESYAVSSGDSSRELQQLERLGGKTAVLTFKFQRWLASLWHGQRLAYTLVFIGAAVALLCWHIASLIDEPETA
jgi:hypothetical protein